VEVKKQITNFLNKTSPNKLIILSGHGELENGLFQINPGIH